jgi:CRISPR/Cas system-associated exonuclease Cas4 (RecB family)
MAMMQINKRPIANLQFYYLNNNSEINFVGSEKDIKAMEEKTLKRIKAIESAFIDGVFPPKPGPLCKYCDYFGICEFRQN